MFSFIKEPLSSFCNIITGNLAFAISGGHSTSFQTAIAIRMDPMKSAPEWMRHDKDMVKKYSPSFCKVITDTLAYVINGVHSSSIQTATAIRMSPTPALARQVKIYVKKSLWTFCKIVTGNLAYVINGVHSSSIQTATAIKMSPMKSAPAFARQVKGTVKRSLSSFCKVITGNLAYVINGGHSSSIQTATANRMSAMKNIPELARQEKNGMVNYRDNLFYVGSCGGDTLARNYLLEYAADEDVNSDYDGVSIDGGDGSDDFLLVNPPSIGTFHHVQVRDYCEDCMYLKDGAVIPTPRCLIHLPDIDYTRYDILNGQGRLISV